MGTPTCPLSKQGQGGKVMSLSELILISSQLIFGLLLLGHLLHILEMLKGDQS